MEAIILAGGKAERLGDVAGGLPKPLVPVAGRPLAAWQIGLLGRAGVERVIVSCGAGAGEQFAAALGGLGVEIAIAEEPERLGRGGGIRFAANERQESGDVLALNGDELVDIDFPSLLATHRANGAAATITVARPKSPFGVVGARRRPGHWLRGGRDDRVLGQLRRLRPRRGRARSFPGARRPRDDSVPRARCRREARRLSPRGTLADDQHPTDLRQADGVRRRAS